MHQYNEAPNFNRMVANFRKKHAIILEKNVISKI